MVTIDGLSPKKHDFFCVVNNQYSQEYSTSDMNQM